MRTIFVNEPDIILILLLSIWISMVKKLLNKHFCTQSFKCETIFCYQVFWTFCATLNLKQNEFVVGQAGDCGFKSSWKLFFDIFQ